MPPKKRARGPKLPTLREEKSIGGASDDSLNESSEFLNNAEFNNEQQEEDNTTINEDARNRNSSEKMTKEDRAMRAASNFIKKRIVDSIRTVFQSRDDINDEIQNCSRKIAVAYRKACNNRGKKVDLVKLFMNEIDARLTMIMEEVTVSEHRARVFKLIAVSITEIDVFNLPKDFFLSIINFIEMWGKSDNVAARINTTCFISYIFETGHRYMKRTGDYFCGYSLELSAKLFLQLKNALLDKEYTARVPAIRGLGYLQGVMIPSNWPDEAKASSPRELLLRSCRDISWECRLVAVQSINPTEADVRLLSDIVYYDKCLNVRVAALEQFGRLRPYRYVREKVQMLDLCLKDHEVTVRDAAKEVLRSWVRKLSSRWSQNQKSKETAEVVEVNRNQNTESEENRMKGFILAGQALALLWLSDVPETTESHCNLRRMITHTLDVIRQMYVCQADPINTFAEVVIADLREKMVESAVPIITKSTVGTLLDDSELAETQDPLTNRSMIFFWRCLMDYIDERKRNDADKINALSRFISPLRTMVDHMESILVRVKNLETMPNEQGVENFEEKTYIVQMSIVENILSVMKHSPADQAGTEAYKELLISMLMNIFYQKKVTDIIVQELAQFYKECPDDFFSLVLLKVNEMREKYRAGKFPNIEKSIHIGESKIRKDLEEEARKGGRRSISDKEGMKVIDFYELKVLNALLKTGILKKWNRSYQDKYGAKFQNGLTSKDLDTRVLCTECIGITGIYEYEMVEDSLCEMFSNFKKEEEPVKCAFITALTDIYIEHGEKVDGIFKSNARQPNFSVVLSDIVVSSNASKDSEALLRAVEGISRLFLNTKIDPDLPKWQRAMVTLMYRASFAITDTFSARIRSTIIVMLKFFCSLSKNNQMLLIKSFRRFFDMWANNYDTELLTENRNDMIPKLKRCAAAFVALSRHSVLPPEEQKKHQPTHVELVNDILHELTLSSDSPAVDYYLCALSYVEYQSFSRTALTKIHGDLEYHIGVHDVESDKHRCNELRKASRKVAKILGINEEDIEEIPVNAEKGRTTKTSKKMLAQMKNIIADEDPMEEDNEMMEEDDAGPSLSDKPAPRKARAAPRSAPASVTKKKIAEGDAINLMKSPPRNPRKPSSRPSTVTRPSAPSTRTALPRSARVLRSQK